MQKKDYMVYGAMIGIVICILAVALVMAGLAAYSIYEQDKIQKQEKIDKQWNEGTSKCQRLGFESFDLNRKVCYTERNIDYKYLSKTYEEINI